ncbi:MAG: hypothetical protein E6K14_01575 [Methanobacteriota archaeon]|nr:MAG: hypothetical protein E6K14_01575 [Euryarchaeota archaeon]
MDRLARVLVGLVGLHLAVTVLHAAAHAALQVFPEGVDLAFIVGVILVGPVAAVGLLRFHRRVAAALAAVSMGLSFVYGVYNHFLVAGPDHVSIVSSEAWTTVFVISGAALGGLEISTAVVAVFVFWSSARTPSGPAEPPA